MENNYMAILNSAITLDGLYMIKRDKGNRFFIKTPKTEYVKEWHYMHDDENAKEFSEGYDWHWYELKARTGFLAIVKDSKPVEFVSF